MNEEFASEHLRWTELACHDDARTPYPVEWRSSRGLLLAQAFEIVREEEGGFPLSILSAYRTPEHNDALRALGIHTATLSEHMEGRALDVGVPRELIAFGQLVCAVFRARERFPLIQGIGIYPSRRSVHFDIRPKELPAVWVG